MSRLAKMGKRKAMKLLLNVLGSVSLLMFMLCAILVVRSSETIRKEQQDVDKLNDPSGRSKRSVTDQQQYLSDGGGAVYTRWGRTVCSDEEQLVYAGVAGGSNFDHTGGGSNYLCLPMDPQFGNIVDGTQNYATIYGAEYELPSSNKIGSFSNTNTNAGVLYENDVPCAVCRIPTGHRAVLMIPARRECYRDWSRRYTGYLMTENHVHKGRTEYICMDEAPEADASGYKNENGALFYQVEGVCGSLPCPPYDNYKELTCVVCSI